MDKLLAAVLTLGLGIGVHAGERIAPESLPQPVAASIQDYFPGSEVVSAERGRDDGRDEYEVRVHYKDIQLEIELAPDGAVLDVDMKTR